MKRIAMFVAAALAVTGAVSAADAKDEVQQAAKKLQEKSNYSWTTTSISPGGQQRFRAGPTEGKTEKGGFTTLSMTLGDNTIEAVIKGDKGAIKTQDGWTSLAEATESEGQQNPARFIARMVQNLRSPGEQAADLAGKVKELKKADDAYTGELTEEGLRELSRFGRRGNDNQQNALRDGSGTVKFWIKDGVLAKYEYHVKGTLNVNNNDISVDRTTTVEIKDVDSTKVTVPEEAKSKAS